MSGIKKILTMSAFILLIMAVFIGCPMLLKDSTVKSGQYIELNIGSETAAKAITVTEYDVTKLDVEIYDPQGALIDDFSWYPGEGQQSYLIPVTGEGEHEIVVTHISDDNGTVIEAEESAFFNIEAMVITAINIIPGLIGYIEITPENGDPPELIDLTGYWDLYWGLEGAPEIGPELFYICQTGSVLECSYGFNGTISGSDITLEAWVEMEEPGLFHVIMTGTVSGGEITGVISGDLGPGTFYFVDSTMPFGRFDFEGTVEGSPISLHTDYAIGMDNGENIFYGLSFDLMIGPIWGNIHIFTEDLGVGHYTTEDMEFNLWDGITSQTAWDGFMEITEFTDKRMTGNLHLNFYDGELNITFELVFGLDFGHIIVGGMWQGSSVFEEMFDVFSNLDVQMSHSYSITYNGCGQEVNLWFSTPGDMISGVPFEEWIDLQWYSDTGPDFEEVSIESVMFTITHLDEDRIIGSFISGPPFDLTGSFDLVLVEGM